MVKRIAARGAWLGLGLALCLGTLEPGAADAPAAADPNSVKASAAKPVAPAMTPEEKAKREKVLAVEKVAKDFSAKRDAGYLTQARERNRKRRESEAAERSPKVEPSDTGKQEPSHANPASLSE